MTDLPRYFGSYAYPTRIVPETTLQEMLEMVEPTCESLSQFGGKAKRISPAHHPEIYAMVQEECAFRNIPEVNYYTLTHMPIGLYPAAAAPHINTVMIDPHYIKTHKDSPDILRALIAHENKHLYQDDLDPDSRTPTDLIREFDSDWASLTSTNRETTLTMIFTILQTMPLGEAKLRPKNRITLDDFLNNPVKAVQNGYDKFNLLHKYGSKKSHADVVKRVKAIELNARELQTPANENF